ncbi:hypothetical protein [Paraburkholderia sediminicola]|uniref:hypothetical protein n=1 Tax=Paraburkholderia sediminicola TaxID=458836 RepID=UPI0038BA3BC2
MEGGRWGRLINEHTLGAYVRAALGMQRVNEEIGENLAPYLDQLSKNAFGLLARPITRSSFTLLCVLYTACQTPGTAEYGQLDRAAGLRG